MKKLEKLLLLLVIFVCVNSVAFAQYEREELQSAGLTGFDADINTTYTLSPNYGSGYTFREFRNFLSLIYQHDAASTITEAFTIEVDFILSAHEYGGANTTENVSLSLSVDPASGALETDLHSHKFSNSDYFNFIISNVQVVSGNVLWNDVKSHFKVLAAIEFDRFKPLDPAQVWTLGTGFTVTPLTLANGIEVDWPDRDDAAEYQLEWLWISDEWRDDPTQDLALMDVNNDQAIDEKDIPVNFGRNATRVTTLLSKYDIPSIYPSGYIVWRVRPMGYINSNVKQLVPGQWTHGNSGASTLYDFTNPMSTLSDFYVRLNQGHQESMNWGYSISFDGQGKNKMMVSYYDGTLRMRQMQARQYDDNGFKVVVGESMYDHFGRPTVSVLPVPVNSTLIDYKPDFTVSNTSGQPFSYRDFMQVDPTTGLPTPEPMSTASGASKYYSSQNDLSGLHKSYIPDAEMYPYQQIVLSNDHLGRPTRQGGVGPNHKIGSGHETEYYYSRVPAEKLYELFGNNVGDPAYYEQVRMVDPNGQSSVNIIDGRGNKVANYLVGAETENNLDDLPGWTPRILEVNLPYTTSDRKDAYEMSTTIDVASSQVYEFNYSFDPSRFTTNCEEAVDLCFECVYNLKIEITDSRGNTYWDANKNVTLGTTNEDCAGSLSPYSILQEQILLEPGEYTIIKSLELDAYTRAEYFKSYISDASCLLNLDDLVGTEMEGCETTFFTCEACETARDQYAVGTEEYAALEALCAELCDPAYAYEGSYQMMLMDVSPGGQYAQYDEGQAYSADAYELSVLKEYNKLPMQTIPAGGSIDEMWYSNPDLKFVNSDGSLSKVLYNGSRVEANRLPLKDFVDNWQSSWAETLVQLHPEYNYYVWSRDVYSANAKSFKTRFHGARSFSEANNLGYLDPLGMSPANFVANTTDIDPLFTEATLGQSRMTEAQDKLNNYIAYPYTDANGVVSERSLSLWEFSVMVAEGMEDPNDAYGYNFSTSTCNFDKMWDVFQALYIQWRAEVIEGLQFEYAYKNQSWNECIGGLVPSNLWTQYKAIPDNHPLSPKTTFMGLYSVQHDRSQPCFSRLKDLFKDKKPRFPRLQQATVFEVEGNSTSDEAYAYAVENMEDACDDACEANVEHWMTLLISCEDQVGVGNWLPGNQEYDNVKQALLLLCGNNCSQEHPYGSMGLPGEVNAILEAEGLVLCEECTELLLDGTYVHQTNFLLQPYAYANLDPCACNKVFSAKLVLAELIEDDQNYSGTLGEVFYDNYGYYLPNIDEVDCHCEAAFALTENACWDEHVEWNAPSIAALEASELVLPAEITCNPCVSCFAFNQSYYALLEEYPSIETNANREYLIANYLNHNLGLYFTFDEYSNYFESCQTITTLVEGRQGYSDPATVSLAGQLETFVEVAFGNFSDFYNTEVEIDLRLSKTPASDPYNLFYTDFDEILPTGVEFIRLELKDNLQDPSYVQLVVTASVPTSGSVATLWTKVVDLRLKLMQSTASGVVHIDDLLSYSGGSARVMATIMLNSNSYYYSGNQLMSNRFELAVMYDNGGGNIDQLTFNGSSSYYNLSALSPQALVQAVGATNSGTSLRYSPYSGEGADCFCDRVSDEYGKWLDSGNSGSITDFLTGEYAHIFAGSTITEMADIEKLLNEKCCTQEFNKKYYQLVVTSGECPNNAPLPVPTPTKFTQLLDELSDCGTGDDDLGIRGWGRSPAEISCAQVIDRLQGVSGGMQGYSSAEVNEMLRGVLGANQMTYYAESDARAHLPVCETCPEPVDMICSTSPVGEDYKQLLIALFTQVDGNGEKLFKTSVNDITNPAAAIYPFFNIESSTLNVSPRTGNLLVRYQAAIISNTKYLARLQFDNTTLGLETEFISLETCCGTIDFEDITEIVRLVPASANDEGAFYLDVKLGSTCGVVRLKGSSRLFSLSSCCTMGGDLCYTRPEYTGNEPCTETPTLSNLSNTVRKYVAQHVSLRESFYTAYNAACLVNKDVFTYSYTDNSHHFTLYYYDQANNLVQTVPPAGVRLLNNAEIDQARSHADDPMHPAIYPQHDLETNYAYNSFEQLIWQRLPDEGVTELFYNDLGILVASQNAEQALSGKYSYIKYDKLARHVEMGELNGATAMSQSVAETEASLNTWYYSGTRSQITGTQYQTALDNTDLASVFTHGQQNLLSRVASVWYKEEEADAEYESATHYSYDIAGNVEMVVQEIAELEAFGQRYKTIEYELDIVNSYVNKIYYQRNQPDQFMHRYSYDAMNRLEMVYTSEDGWHWERDVEYSFYDHGSLGRVVLGDQGVQGIDYVYTLMGWVKSANSDYLSDSQDPGSDGSTSLTAQDAFGFSLGYYDGDYTPIDPGQANHLTVGTNNLGNSLYNGTVKHMVTAIEPFMAGGSPMANAYRYDQLNRITGSTSFESMNVSTHSWSNAIASNKYETAFGYDANGNMLSLNRKGDGAGASNWDMDDLTYQYYSGTNRLMAVNDAVDNAMYDNDFDDQGTSAATYTYDAAGNLESDLTEEIENIEWNSYGSIKSINHQSTSSKADLAFQYGPMGNRIIKRALPKDLHKERYSYYVRDADGRVLAVYELSGDKHFEADFLNYADLNTSLLELSNFNLNDFKGFLTGNFGTDAAFKTALEAAIIANDPGHAVYSQYSLSALYTMDVEFYKDNLRAYPSTDLVSRIGTAAALSTMIDDLYGCDASTFLDALLAHNATAFINHLHNTSPTTTASLCSYFYGGACPNGPQVDLPTVNRSQLISQLLSQNATTIKTAIAQFSASDLGNAIDLHTGPGWLATQLISCGTQADYEAVLVANSSTSRQHLLTYMGYSALLNRILQHDATELIEATVDADRTLIDAALELTLGYAVADYVEAIKAIDGTGDMYDEVLEAMRGAVNEYDLTLKWAEQHLYGNKRLGLKKPNKMMYGKKFTGNYSTSLLDYVVTGQEVAYQPVQEEHKYTRQRGLKRYELTNHLGNVLAVVSDRRLSVAHSGTNTHSHYKADVLEAQDYYPFGMTMPGREYKVAANEQAYSPVTVLESVDVDEFEADEESWVAFGGTVTQDPVLERLEVESSTPWHGAVKNYTTVAGEQYKVQFDLDMAAFSNIYVEVRDIVSGSQTTLVSGWQQSSGTVEYTFTAIGSTTRLLVLRGGNGTRSFYLDNVSFSKLSVADAGQLMAVSEGYRYAFNGMEGESELYGSGGAYSTFYRMYNSQLGRWFSVDPEHRKYPSHSPYSFANNAPLSFADPRGDDPVTAIGEAALAFGLEYGLAFFSAIVFDGESISGAFGKANKELPAAGYEAGKAFLLAFVTPTGTALAQKVYKISQSKVGKLALEWVGTYVEEVFKMYINGEMNDEEGEFSTDLMVDVLQEALSNTLVGVGVGRAMGGAAERYKLSIGQHRQHIKDQRERIDRLWDGPADPGAIVHAQDMRFSRISDHQDRIKWLRQQRKRRKAFEEFLKKTGEQTIGAHIFLPTIVIIWEKVESSLGPESGVSEYKVEVKIDG